MTERTEEEQVEALKKWLDDNGTSMIIGIVLTLGGVFGYQTWEKSVQETGEAASSLYQNLAEVTAVGPLETLTAEKKSTAKFIADQLKTDYSGSTYATFAALHLAKLAVLDKDLDKAASELQWALDQGVDKTLLPLVNLRLAQVRFGQKDYEAALKLLQGNVGEHASSFAELRGDIYFAQGENEKAREAYQEGVNNMSDANAKPLLKMKLEDLVVPDTIMADDKVADTSGEAS